MSAPSYPVTIWIAGDLDNIRSYVRVWCHTHNICATVTATEFFYVGGSETGARIGLAHYPRFELKSFENELDTTAKSLASALIIDGCQTSALVETRSESIWVTNRPDGKSPTEQ